MSLPTANFWRLLEESRLQTPEQCRQLAADFASVKGAQDQSNSKTLAEWLVARNILSKYQTTILLAGRSGPFIYGDYNVYDRIDKGRLAGSFRAVHRPTGHPVMLTFLTGPIIQDSQLWAVAANDALAACSIESPHVQRFFEPVDLISFKFLVSEDLRGSTAEERLAAGRFSVPEACRLVRMAAIGLAQMHQLGRVHGDVRPANLWIENASPQNPGNLKLLFEAQSHAGPINFAQDSARLSAMADYLAPELMQAGKVPDPLSDVYALGCTLYGLLSGNPPFAGGNVQQKMVRHASEGIRPLDQFGVPQSLAQLVTYMMAKNPAVRFQSAAIVAEQLTPFVDPQVVYAQPPAPPATQALYENFIRQKQTQLAAQAAAPKPAAPAMPGLNLNLDLPKPARASEARPPKGGTPAPSGPVIQVAESKPADPVTAAALEEAKQKRLTRNLLVGLGAVAVLAIAGIIGINMMGGGDNGEKVATGPKAGIPGENDRANGGTGNTKVTNTSSSGGTNTSLPDSEKGTSETIKNGKAGTPTTVAKPPLTDTAPAQEVVPDDGSLLWASPTSGQAVSFRCVPPEGQVFIVLRPADILASAEGPKVLDALGPAFLAQRQLFESAAGLPLDQVEQLLITLHNNGGKFPRASCVVKTKEPISKEDLLAKWGDPAEQKEGSATYYLGKGTAYYFSGAVDDERTFLMGDPIDVKEVAKLAGAQPPMLRDVERLRRSTDGDRHVTVLFHPAFFFNDDGAPLFAGDRAKVKQPLDWFLGDGIQAGLVSLHFGDDFYLEMRVLGSLDKEKFSLAKELRERLKQVPSKLEDYFVTLTPPPYWKKLAFRYPRMITTLHENTRVGVESDQAVINSYLEGPAAHNLALGGELLIAQAPGAAVAVGPTTTEKPAVKTLEEALALPTSFSFDSQSLEFAMRDLAEDVRTNLLKGSAVNFEIKIIGDDLKLDGITRNQSVRDFKQENKTVAEVLTALVRKANPVTTVKDPSELDQKLLWVVGPDPDNAEKQVILITTRQMAEKKMYKLPDVFKPKK